jgi:hypothetical protein
LTIGLGDGGALHRYLLGASSWSFNFLVDVFGGKFWSSLHFFIFVLLYKRVFSSPYIGTAIYGFIIKWDENLF